MSIKAPEKGITSVSADIDGPKAQKGSDPYDALKVCFERDYGQLFNHALGIVRTAEAADEVVQEVFTNTIAAIERGNTVDNLDGWLKRCVHNGSVSYIRNPNRKWQPLKESFDPIDPGSMPELAFARRRCNRSICEAVDGLTPAQRSVFLLAELKGLKQREIAVTLKCSENSVSQLLLRARKHVRQAIGRDRFVAVPLFWLFGRMFRLKERCHTFHQSASTKARHLHTATSSSVRHSLEMIGQPATAIVAGTAIVVALGVLSAERNRATKYTGSNSRSKAIAPASSSDERSPLAATKNGAARGEGANGEGHSATTEPVTVTGGPSSNTPGTEYGVTGSKEGKFDLAGGSQAGGPGSATGGGPSGSSNGNIAFTTDRDGNEEIYSMSPNGGDQKNLTNNAADDFEASWSGDGSKIAFATSRNGKREIYSMNADGSGQKRLTVSPKTGNQPAWSADGSKIAFRSDRSGGNFEIYIMDADGSGETNLTNNPAGEKSPAWSADGLSIAFESNRDDPSSDIYVTSISGNTVKNLTGSPGTSEREPAWSPDGAKIAFETNRDGNSEIYVMSADGSGKSRLTKNAAADRSPVWSPDGAKIAFQSNRDGNDEIYVMNADGSGKANISQSPASNEYAPAW